ncbi:MAG TPA: hypothetical protein VI077_13510 [Pseudolabrys sp.]
MAKIAKIKEGKTAILNLRCRPSVKFLAVARAAAVDRSVSSYVEQLILRDAEANPVDEPKPKKKRR